jgi:hypothetical protein
LLDDQTLPVAGPPPSLEVLFEQWWQGYPDKIGKGAARKSFARALGKTTFDRLIAGVERYKTTKPSDRPWCNPTTWLNQERWTDEFAPTNGHHLTIDQVVTGLFNGSRVTADAFRSDILVRAGKLDLGRVVDTDLAVCLGELYTAMRAQRATGSALSDKSGPMDLLRRYLIWLSDQDWRMTMRVLRIDSPAFQQFRREEAHRHPYGADPLTGR